MNRRGFLGRLFQGVALGFCSAWFNWRALLPPEGKDPFRDLSEQDIAAIDRGMDSIFKNAYAADLMMLPPSNTELFA